ncbi:DUF4129 domain-containing protein [Microbacterium sp. ARD32]|uniref:DUF4129 domain-containing protein n=1 Tax=Microbacterium sp. ARD32 TaxID=2962577 RepID=UPI0028812E1D|nr:DUF4129 domain-containing protein [Microbacterium sp. ARD32]MDT0157491.1 DUF4129 domain-containing protein [Microbacterium sp. ARD32]
MTGAVQHDAEDATVVGARRRGSVLRRLLPVMITIALFAIAILATSIAGHPTLRAIPDYTPVPEPRVTQTSDFVPQPPPQHEAEGPDSTLIIIGVVLALIVLGLLALGLAWLVRAIIDALRNGALPERAGAELDSEIAGAPLPEEAEPDAPVIRRGIAAARTAIEGDTDPGDAIIAAWIGLEETAKDSGAGRGVSETPAEFTLRILLRRPGIEDPTRRLLDLYEGVRFGGHAAGEPDRAAAAEALAQIEEGWR